MKGKSELAVMYTVYTLGALGTRDIKREKSVQMIERDDVKD